MEQSILTPEAQRWVNAITKLTSLTYANKLTWVKNLSDTEAANVYLGVKSMSARYSAEFEGERFLLSVTPPASALTSDSSWSQLLGLPGYAPESSVSLQVFDWQGARVINVPNLSVLQPLADAVQSQADSREETVLSAIEKAEV